MPGEVEQADRHAPIDRGRAAQLRRVHQAILPGARENRQSEVAAAPRSRVAFEQRPDELMGILTGAAAIAQRGPIVDEDAHLCKSFRLSILL